MGKLHEQATHTKNINVHIKMWPKNKKDHNYEKLLKLTIREIQIKNTDITSIKLGESMTIHSFCWWSWGETYSLTSQPRGLFLRTTFLRRILHQLMKWHLYVPSDRAVPLLGSDTGGSIELHVHSKVSHCSTVSNYKVLGKHSKCHTLGSGWINYYTSTKWSLCAAIF